MLSEYNTLTSRGLCVFPRNPHKKIPAVKWKNVDPPTLEHAIRMQRTGKAAGWVVRTGDGILVVDLDVSAELSKEFFLSVAPTDFIIRTPSGGWHLYYRIDRRVHTSAGKVARGVDIRADGGIAVSLGSTSTYSGVDAAKRGLPDGFTGEYTLFRDGEIGTATPELYDMLAEKPKPKDTAGEKYGLSAEAQEWVRQFLAQEQDQRDKTVIEMIDIIVSTWDDGTVAYDRWLAFWMSAHHASSGSEVVGKYIAYNQKIHFSGDRTHWFQHWWKTHQPRSDGYTVATLRYMAKEAGWRSRTGYEIVVSEHINYARVSEWLSELPEIPNRLLLQSQTGSGKTYALSLLWERMGRPKTLVLVPTIKLAEELAATLRARHGMPAVMYRDIGGNIRGLDEMKSADVLVTTLQTFAIRMWRDGYVDLTEYGLMYIEECDQLLSSFARATKSHVTEEQAQAGFAMLREAFSLPMTIWGVDATMTQVSQCLFQTFSKEVRVIVNDYTTQKPDVTMLDSQEDAYNIAYEALVMGKKVVIAVDTWKLATRMEEFVNQVASLTDIPYIRITGRDDGQVQRDFMADVNAGAEKYQLVIYNSVMASGVSIDKVKPDVFIHIGGYLTPRANLQIHNRYRLQNEVYVVYQNARQRHVYTDDQLREIHLQRAQTEAGVVRVPLVDRHSDAVLRDVMAAISMADEDAQRRDQRGFFIALLRSDGRVVHDGRAKTSYAVVREHMARKADHKDYVRSNWLMIAPDFDQKLSEEERAAAIFHARVLRAFPEGIPDASPELIYDVLHSVGSKTYALMALADQQRSIRQATKSVLDEKRATLSVRTEVARASLISKCALLFPSFDTALSAETDVSGFLEGFPEGLYNIITGDPDISYARGREKSATDIEFAAFLAKHLLKTVGLKVRKDKRSNKTDPHVWRLDNIEHARTFLQWKGLDITSFTFSAPTDVLELYDAVDDKTIVHQRVKQGMSWEDAVLTAHLGNDRFSEIGA